MRPGSQNSATLDQLVIHTRCLSLARAAHFPFRHRPRCDPRSTTRTVLDPMASSVGKRRAEDANGRRGGDGRLALNAWP